MKARTFLSILMLAIVSLSSAQRVLYIGDSVTDGGWGRSGGSALPSEKRNRSDLNHIYGHSYVMLCAAHYQCLLPSKDWQFWNRGISGNTLYQMADRWQQDALDLNPDVISILIGTNDVGAYEKQMKESLQPITITGFDYQGWERQYRQLLDDSRCQLPAVRFVLCTPFTGKSLGKERRAITDSLAQIVRHIARDYNAVLVPFDRLFAQLQKDEPTPGYWIWDGIHPTAAGHLKMAELWELKVSGPKKKRMTRW